MEELDTPLKPLVAVYLIISWVVEAKSESNGFGFPFDRPHLDFYLRLQEAYPELKALKQQMSTDASLLPLMPLRNTLADTMLAQTPLVKNLENPQYMEILLNGKADLAERFAEIDIVQVRKAFDQAQRVTQKYPKRMAEVFKIPNLPQRLLEAPSKKSAVS